MRILHLAAGNLYGGVERLLVTLAGDCELRGSMEPEFGLCFDGNLAEELRRVGARVHLLGAVRASRPRSVIQARRQLARLNGIRRFDLAVCHAFWPTAIFGHTIKSTGIPLIVWMHDSPTTHHWIDLWARLTTPDLVICNSRFTTESVAKVYPRVEKKVIYSPVELVSSNGSQSDRTTVRQEMNTHSDEVVIVQASRMEPWKGHALHLKALRSLADLPNWVCWIVGGPQRPFETRYFEGLHAIVKQYGIEHRVRFLGFRRDVHRLLAAADIFCQPNTAPEPFGISFVEALLSRLPVITTNIGGAREIVDPSCGILVPEGDASALADALRAAISNEEFRSRLGAAGPARALLLCDTRNQMCRLAEVFGKIILPKENRGHSRRLGETTL